MLIGPTRLAIPEEEIEDTKGVIRIHKSKDRHNGQTETIKRPNNDLQNITKKSKDRITRTSQKINGGELRCSASVNISCSTSGTREVCLYFAKKSCFTAKIIIVFNYVILSS